MRILVLASTLAALCSAWPVHAAVVETTTNGLAIEEKVHIAASPDKVYVALTHPEKWWNPEHTFSHDAKNLSLDPKAGGCLCETLPNGGSVQHLTVAFAEPGKMLRFRGAMGPFQREGVDGALTFSLAPKDGGTDLMLDVLWGGYYHGGFKDIAVPADGMLTDLVTRLKQYAEAAK